MIPTPCPDSASRHRRRASRLLALLIGLVSVPVSWVNAAGSPYYDPETGQPQLRLLALRIASARLRLEYEREERRVVYDNATPPLEEDVQYMAALVDLLFHGSLLHPNLLTFSLSTSLGLDQQERLNASGDTTTESSVQSYNVNIGILRAKPYGFTLFGNKQRHRREYDFFNRAVVKSERYGGYFGYDHPTTPLRIKLERWKEEEPDLERPRSREEDSVSVSLRHIRSPKERMELYYGMDAYLHVHEDATTLDGRTQQARFTDTRSMGPDNKYDLRSTARYGVRENFKGGSKVRSLTLGEDLDIAHPWRFSSRVAYHFTTASSQDNLNRRNSARWQLTHKLYKSLRSSLSLNGYLSETDGTDSSSETIRYGAGLGEYYTKRLGGVGFLNMNLALKAFQDEHTAEGATTETIDERHRLTDGQVVLLNRSDVAVSTIQVMDTAGKTLYQEGSDYTIVEVGDYVEIQRIPGGDIPNGGTVLVSYSAADESEDATSVTDRRFASTVRLFDDRVRVYGRIHNIDSTSTRQLALADALDQVVGVKLSAWNIGVGGEYRDRSSPSASYTATRTYQSCSFHPGKRSTLALRASQSEVDYSDSPNNQWTHSYIMRYNTYPRIGWWFSVEGGLHREKGDRRNRDRRTVRGSLRYSYRRLSLTMSYGFEEEEAKDASRNDREQFVKATIIRRF